MKTAWLSLSGYFLIGGLFALPALISKHQYKLSSNPIHRIIGLLFMVYGAALYPLLEIITGLNYPGIVLFGAECPTFIFVIGLLIASLPTVNKIFFGILLTYSLISSFFAVRLEVWVDIGYLAASISGIILYIQEIIRIRNNKSLI